jgi:hypothetical protein
MQIYKIRGLVIIISGVHTAGGGVQTHPQGQQKKENCDIIDDV